MKRKKLLPADIEKIDRLIPYRLTEEDLEKLKITIAGFDFLNLGGVLACPKCGQPQQLQSQVALDEQVYFFVKFLCTDYPSQQAIQISAPDTAELSQA